MGGIQSCWLRTAWPGVASRPNRRILGIGELGRRLIAAFASVALATVVAEIVIASVIASTDVNQLVRTQETQLTRAAAATAGVAYMGGSNFSGIRLGHTGGPRF